MVVEYLFCYEEKIIGKIRGIRSIVDTFSEYIFINIPYFGWHKWREWSGLGINRFEKDKF